MAQASLSPAPRPHLLPGEVQRRTSPGVHFDCLLRDSAAPTAVCGLLHQDPKAYIALLDDPARDAYQKPHEVLAALNLEEGEVIADIGAGSGYFTFRLAQHVGSSGRVYAIDVSPDMIIYLNRRIRDLRLTTVLTILAPPDDPLMADSSVDRFFISETWHHIENNDRYLALLKKALKPGGQVVIIDFKKTEMPVGPPLQMRIDRGTLIKEMEKNGFHLAAEYTFLPYQYFLIFKMKDASAG